MIDLAPYSDVLVLDTQVILEGKPLEELPWEQLGADGPILLLCTPTMLSEVDRRKRDGRLGERARRFNRLVEPAIGTSEPVPLLNHPPRVDVALVAVDSINWQELGDLDPNSGDDRIVAEALFARVSDTSRLTMFSYDMRPRSAATRHGLASAKPPEEWIYEPEPSPVEKDNLRLRQRVRDLEASQPEIIATLDIDGDLPVKVLVVEPLQDDAAEALAERILAMHPRSAQQDWIALRDPGYDGRYDEFVKKVRRYGRNLSRALERLFNQVSFQFGFAVEGSVGASHLDVQLRATGAALYDKMIVKDIAPPKPPRREQLWATPLWSGPTLADLMTKVPRHQVVFDPQPSRGPSLRLACEDFRHGRTFTKRIYAELNAKAQNSAEVRLTITAANMKGSVERAISIPIESDCVKVEDLIELDAQSMRREYRLQALFNELISRNETDEIES